MADILKIIVILLSAAFLNGKPIYRPGKFLYSRCTYDKDNVYGTLACDPLNITKARKEKPSVWPPGPYAIPMKNGACPEPESYGWKKSIFKIKQTSEDKDLHLSFCVKVDRNLTLDKGKWMTGMYSIYMSGVTCPEGFEDFNRTLAYITFSHFGPVPNFSFVDDGETKNITFYMCGRNSTHMYRDESEFGKTDIQFLSKQFSEDEGGAGRTGTSYFTSGLLDLDSHLRITSGYLPGRRRKDHRKKEPESSPQFPRIARNHRGKIAWYQLDLGRTLSVFEIEVYGRNKDSYRGCYYDNVKWNVLHQDATVCNVDVNVGSSNLLSLVMRYVVQARFITLLFNGRKELQTLSNKDVFLKLSDLPDICNEDLGMDDGSIQDFQITASSWLQQYMPWAARPWGVGWCADVSDSRPWILVDLIAVTRVEGLRMWNWGRSQDTVHHNITGCSSFDLFYGFNIDKLVMYNDMEFIGHEGLMTGVQTFMLVNSIDARYVKLQIRNCVDHNKTCLRFELHGCKLAGVPTLDCQNEFDMFELDNEIRTEGNPIIYRNRTSLENCSSLCSQNKNCSIVSYSKEERCIEYPSSNLGMWQIAYTITGKWFAKLCDTGQVELFPNVWILDDDGFILGTMKNVEYIERDSIIKSIGYPFSYGNGQDYAWVIKYPVERYVKIVFTNLSLSNEHEECYDRIRISSTIDGKGQEISHRYNGRIFVIETEVSLLFLTFYSCFAHRNVTERRGLRAIVTGEEIPACLSIGFNHFHWSDGRWRELCLLRDMIVTSLSILNIPFGNVEESWEIHANPEIHHTVQLHILEFYVMCPQVAGDIRSRFAVVEMSEERTFCNTDKPSDVICSKAASISVKFLRQVDPNTVYLRTEGFRLRFSMIEHSLATLKHHGLLRSKVCSKTFWKCYHVKQSLMTWNQASKTCRKCDQTLVSVQSENELQFVNYILRDLRYRSKINAEDAVSFSSHIGLRRVNHGHWTYVWENASPATYFPWKLGYPVAGKDCTRTNFQFISNRTLESEDCSTDLSLYFVCQTPMTENEAGGEGRHTCEGENNDPDIVFMIDSSGLFRIFHKMIKFVRKLIRMFDVGPHATQISVVTFSDSAKTAFYFNDINTNKEAQKMIDEIRLHEGTGAYTNLALEVMHLDVFSTSKGARNNVPRIGILMTHKSPSDQSEALEQAQLAKAAGIKLLAIGIGTDVDEKELRYIVSKPSGKHYIHRNDAKEVGSDLMFDILRLISNIVTSAVNICEDVVWKKWKRTENINITFFGTTCQAWTTLSTSAENNFKNRFPDIVIPNEVHNFCQDPDSSGILWCYTAGSSQYLWEPCFMQVSNMESKYVISENTEDDSNCKGECEDGRSTICDNVCILCDGVFNRNDFSDETLCREKGHHLINNEVVRLTEKPLERLERGPYFLCGSKEWISILAKCDDVIDCADASDEISCSRLDTGFIENMFSCNDDDCEVCDFTSDDTTAEEELRKFRVCETDEYECKNKQCISTDKRCNAILDCVDGSDEIHCDSCKDSFHCDNVKCILMRLKCDTVQDCEDGTDENSCVPESLSSCDQWWEYGYHTSGYYVIDEIIVYCDFTSIKKSGKITMSLRNIDVALDGDKGQMYTRSLYDNFVQFSTPKFQNLIYRGGYSCLLEVERSCQFNIAGSIIDGSADDDTYQDCHCTVDTLKAEKPDQGPIRFPNESTNGYRFVRHKSFNCNRTEHSGYAIDKGYYNVTGVGYFNVDSRILNTEIPTQIVPEQIVCTYEYRNEMIACQGEHREIPPSMLCVYDVDSAGVMTGCRSGTHLQDCGNYPCPTNTVKCPGSYCIPLKFVCDGRVQCPNGQDEHECTCTDTAREVLIFVEDVSEYRESKTAAVKLAEQFYTTGSDIRLLHIKPTAPLKEYGIEHRLLEIREEHNYTFQRFDPVKECRYKSMARNLLGQIQFATHNTKGIVFIEDSLEFSEVAELMFSNLSKPGFMIYRVLKDFNFTVNHVSTDSYRFVKDVPVRKWNALFSIGYKRFPEICKAASEVPCAGGYRCASSKQCIPTEQICDGITQCHHKDDERLCDLYCPYNCTCIGYTVRCHDVNMKYIDTKVLSLNTRIADMSKNPDLKHMLMKPSFRFSSMTKLNLSSCEIASVNKNGFTYLRHLECLDIGYNRIQMLPENLFNNLEHLVFLNLDGNFDLQEISSTAFHGLRSIRSLRITGTKLKRVSSFTFSYMTLQSINISYNELIEIEDYAFNGTSVERIDFRGNKILTVSRMMFDGVSLLEELQTPAFKFCCIRPCSVDESNCFPPKNEFSSCEDLMRHPVLQAVLWIVGSTALLGNLGSMFYRIVYDRERLKIGYGIFVTNLAGADFLMGVYLIMIAIVDSFYRNRYIFFDDKWRNSAWCVTAGILSTVSSEASVLFVCFITLDRLLVIKYPFGNRRFEPRKAYICCIMSWTVAIVIALIPVVFTGYFKNRFYSRSAVCIALPLTRDKPPGWMYSVGIFVGLNFCTFMLVAFGQLSIFLELRKATAGMKKTLISRKRDLQVARNLIFVATTDFLCWFPIGLMGIMALNGYPISGDVYAWTAVFILPLNSALNPILYTLTAIIGKQSFKPNIEEQDRIEIQKEMASRILKHQELTKSVQIKRDMARIGQSLNDLLEQDEPIPLATVVAIGIQLSRYLSHLHESSIAIEQLSTDTTYVKVSKKKKHRVNIVLDSKLSVSNDEKILQDNIYQLGELLRRLIAKRR